MTMKLTEDEKGILRRALSRHYHGLQRAAENCSGGLYPVIYSGEADRTAELLRKLVGKKEKVLSLDMAKLHEQVGQTV
jgi:hypothetical protein